MEANTILKPSPIHGIGVFATELIKEGEQIFQPLKIDLSQNVDEWIAYNASGQPRSGALMYGFSMVNHSDIPNVHNIGAGDNQKQVAKRSILPGEEIVEDYNALPDNENPFKSEIIVGLIDYMANPHLREEL